MKKVIEYLDSLFYSWDSCEVLILNKYGVPINSYTQRNKIGKISTFLNKYGTFTGV